MKKFRNFLLEKRGMADLSGLDMDFIRRAEKVTAFNLTTKDFETLKNKQEIQYLFIKNFFPDFDSNKFLDKVDMSALNRLIDGLRSKHKNDFVKLHKYPLKGVGPGEATMYFLINNAHLGGGASAGVDLVVGGKNYEIKAVDVSRDGFAKNFKVGGTFSLSSIISGLQKLKKDVGGSGSEVNTGDLNKIRQQFPAELKKLEQEYIDLTYKNYFSKEEIIFIYNSGPNLGKIAAVKKVQKSDIRLERVTSGTIKPLVKL